MTTVTFRSRKHPTLQSVVATPPPVDTNVLFSHFLENVSFALTHLDKLAATGQQQVDAIVRHTANGDLLAVTEAAQSLKGAAAILAAEPLRGKVAEIEAAGRHAAPSNLLDMVHDMRGEMDHCLAYIPTLRAETQQR